MIIYYLARSFPPLDQGGGALLREGAVDYFIEYGYTVKVVVPNYETNEYLTKDNIIYIPFNVKYRQKLFSFLERVGYFEDYLDIWINTAYMYLLQVIKKGDLIFATSGGELGMIKLGSKLKSSTNTKFIINYRDPLNYGYMNGLRRDKKFHVGRIKIQKKYMENANCIITSSLYYSKILKLGFPELKERIYCNYFGYKKPVKQIVNINKNTVKNFAYTGLFSTTQKPEILFHTMFKYGLIEKFKVTYIGNFQNYKPISNIQHKNINKIPYLHKEDFTNYIQRNIDIGFLSLSRLYYSACVPSKLYEYINLGLPILAFVPKGDAFDIINDNNFGIAVEYGDYKSLYKAIIQISNDLVYDKYKLNILNNRIEWSMNNKIKEVINLIQNV